MKKGFCRKGIAGFELSLLIVSLFTFSYMIYSVDVVSGQDNLPSIDSRNNVISNTPSPTNVMVEVVSESSAKTILTDSSGRYLVQGGTLADGKSVEVVNIVTGKSHTISDLDLSGYSQSAATGAEQLYSSKLVTIGGHETTLANALSNQEVATSLMKDSTALDSLGYRSMEGSVEEGFTLVGKDGSVTAISDGGVVGGTTEPGSKVSGWLNLQAGGVADALVSGLQWAGIAYMAGQLVGGLFGMDAGQTKALSYGLGAGFGSYKALSVYSKSKLPFLTKHPALSGLGIGLIVFISMYKTVDTEVVTFDCLAWQAPTGGNDCEVCNDDNLPCSEYRCRALGQACEIVNVGTEEERCVYVNPRDVDPPVVNPWTEALTSGHEYVDVRASPPGPGFGIVNSEASDGCLQAFTPLEFGLVADEPAQCKISFEHTESFDEMGTYVGGSNLFAYEHKERFSLPSAEALKNSSLVLENGKDLVFYIRCVDKNGNENEAEYAVKLCVDPSPDNTAPKVEATSVIDGGCVAEDQDTAEVEFYTNEPADCRWSVDDQDFDNMVNGMSCSGSLYQANAAQLFACVAELTGISRVDTKFYVRCKDQPAGSGQQVESDRNEMKQSYEFSLIGSTGLKMKNLSPNETIFGAVSPFPVELRAETLFGCNDGRAVCYYSPSENDDAYIMFFDTDSDDGVHTQSLSLTDGAHEYFIKCIDEGGNLVEDSVRFDLDIDTDAPVIARIYEEDQMLKIVTVRNSECAYSLNDCDFSFVEGTSMPYANTTNHVVEWNNQNTYYIKCRDEFRNEDADCSAIVRPTRSFL